MSKLPSEILNAVYQHLSKEDVFQCALTCKRWKESALPIFYKDLHIDLFGIARTEILLRLDPTERDRYFQYSTFTKRLVVHWDDTYKSQPYGIHVSIEGSDGEYTKEEWILLLEHLPNIQVLDLRSSANAHKYMQYILNCTDSDKILHKIRVIMPGGRRSYMSGTDDSYDIYFAVCYKYHTTITTLKVEYNSSSFNLGPINGDVLTLLNHFNNLTHLTFFNSCDHQLTTFDIMDSCPHLVSLRYKSDYSIPEVIVKNILEGNIIRKRLNNSFKELHLTVPTISTHYVDYLKDYVAPHLDVLTMKICNTDVFDWVEIIGLGNAVDFLRILSKVKTVSISWEPDKRYNRQTTSTESEPTIFFTLLNAMRRNKTIYCGANYNQYDSACKSFSLTPDDYLCFNYGLKESDYYLPLNNQDSEQEDSSTRPIQLLTPNLSTSMIGPEVIFRMDVILGDTDLNLPLELLRYALVNCPNLQRFLYKSTSNYNRSICIEVEPKMSGDIVKSKKKISIATQKDIKVVKTGNMVPSKELLRLLHKHLPATEKLICGMDDCKDPPTELFEVDLIPFIHLKSVQLNVLLLCDEDQDTAFLELQFADRDCGYYCLKIDDPDLTVTKITLKQMKKQIGEANKSIRKAVIKCHKRVRFRLSYEYSMGVEICNGKNSIFYGGVNLELLYPHSF